MIEGMLRTPSEAEEQAGIWTCVMEIIKMAGLAVKLAVRRMQEKYEW
jgi:hypothetical protein